MTRYDTIGINYADLRIPDPQISAAIEQALGPAHTVINVGAGTGSYEPNDRIVTAVEPSIEMIRKRRQPAAAVVQASADALPFADKAFDAAMAILTIHHWPDKAAGLREVRRVTKGRIVLLTFDPAQRPWLTDYLPELARLDDAQMPAMADYARWLGDVRIAPLWVAHDCTDGFLYAYWRRPEAYLDTRIRSGSSSFWALPGLEAGLARLADDLQSGRGISVMVTCGARRRMTRATASSSRKQTAQRADRRARAREKGRHLPAPALPFAARERLTSPWRNPRN